jgi:AbrB family looped-hinge helix DNA binding protein
MSWITAPLGPKGQITLPKEVREALGLKEKGDLVGFVLDEKTGSVRLSRMEIRPAAGEEYTEEELRKMMGLAKASGGKKFDSAEAFLRHLGKQ